MKLKHIYVEARILINSQNTRQFKDTVGTTSQQLSSYDVIRRLTLYQP